MKNKLVSFFNTVIEKLFKPLDYIIIILSIISIIGLIIVGEWRLIGLCVIMIFFIRWIMSLIFILFTLLNNLVEKVSYKNRAIGNILEYFVIVFFNLIIIAEFFLAVFICIIVTYEGNRGIDLLPFRTATWVLAFIPLRFMSKAIKEDNEEFSSLYVIYAVTFLITLPTAFLGQIYSIFSTSILVIVTFVLIPVYLFKKSSNPFSIDY
jgi:hypothetical protein